MRSSLANAPRSRSNVPAAHIRTVRASFLRLGAAPPETRQIVRWLGPNGLDVVLAAIERVDDRRGGHLPPEDIERELDAGAWRALREARRG